MNLAGIGDDIGVRKCLALGWLNTLDFVVVLGRHDDGKFVGCQEYWRWWFSDWSTTGIMKRLTMVDGISMIPSLDIDQSPTESMCTSHPPRTFP